MTHHRGEMLGGRYALDERIALGGMGEVWAGTDTVLGRAVAVKVLRTDNASALLERFRNEARHTAALSHSGIAHVHDYGEDGADAFLVMELVPGEPLSAVLRKGALPVSVALSYLAQTAEALTAAHAMGVVHRDIKPGNLMILPDGTVKVTDFGIARLLDSASMTAVGQVVGTAQYMAPEQAGGEPATGLSDIYSLGAVGYEMLAGKPAFSGDNPLALAMAHVHQTPPDLPDSIPEGVRSLINRMMSKNPADRPATAAAVANEVWDLQRELLPSPVDSTERADDDSPATVASTATVAALAPTAMSPAGDPPTAVMPPGLIVGESAPLLDRDFVRQARSKPRVIAAVIVLVAALVVVLALSVANNNSPLTAADVPTSGALATATTAAPATTTAIPPTTVAVSTTAVTVLVDPKVLIGLKKDDAVAKLEALGLRVVTKEEKGHANAEKNTVVGVEPSGEVAPGSTVTLLIAGKK
jgi:eukaryotic-like serine/threonine-protein kinase